jgi:hypothetical protein
MSKKKDGEERRDREGHESERREEPHGTGYGTERKVYLEYLRRRWEGSAPPTAEAYTRALKLWRQLPGSVVTVPADIATVPEPAATGEANPQPPKPPGHTGDKGDRS